MAFSPTHSPVYGGDTLSIILSHDQLLQASASSSTASLPQSLFSSVSAEDAKYFVVFEGSRRRHVVSARAVSDSRRPLGATPVDDPVEQMGDSAVVMDSDEESENKDSYIRLQTIIPGHDIAEEVTVTLIQLCEEEVFSEDEEEEKENRLEREAQRGSRYPSHDASVYSDSSGHGEPEDAETLTVTVRVCQVPVASTVLRYEYDSTFYLTKFLASSVYNDHALDNLELIKSDRFDLSNEVLSTLDVRLSRALRNANLTSSGDWHILGGDSITDAHCEERETLLHLCARLGLRRVAAYLLERPGSEDALRLPNRHGELPFALATVNGFHDLAEMLSGYNTHGMVTSQQDVVELENAVLRNYGNGMASLTSFLDSPSLERTVENEINFLRETEEMIRVQHGLIPSASQYNSDWPHSGALQNHTGASRSLPTLPTAESEVEASLDRVLRQQNINRESLHTYLRGPPAAPGQAHTAPSSQIPADKSAPVSGETSSDGVGKLYGNIHAADFKPGYSDSRDSGGAETSSDGSRLEDAGDAFTVTNLPPLLQQQQQRWARQALASTSSYASSSSPGSSSVFASNSPLSAAYGHQYFFPGSPAARPVSLQQVGMSSLSRAASSGQEEEGEGEEEPARSQYSVLECSLGGVRDLTEGLFQLRDSQLHHRLLLKDRRRRQFGRHSSSCPTLSAPVTFTALSPVDETDHHKSMHDLIEELGTASRLSTSPTPDQRSVSPSGEDAGAACLRSENFQPQQDTQGDQAIRICVNGVTVDSSDDLASAAGSSRPISAESGEDRGSPSHRKNARLRDGGDEVESLNRRGSWCPENTTVRTGLPLDRRDQQTRVRMLAMTGKSLSLTSLDGGEVSDEEDFLNSPTEEAPAGTPLTLPGTVTPSPPRPLHTTTAAITVRQQQRLPHHSNNRYHRATRTQSDAEIEKDTRSRSPVDSTGSSPTGRDIGEDLNLTSHGARSLTDISVTATSSLDEKPSGSLTHSSSSPAHRAHHSYDDGTALVVPHSNMTKSLSTPSIPQATEAAGPSSGRREGKQHDANAFQNFLDDYNAQFRRQKEIEEEEEDESSTLGREKKSQEISWRDFLSEEQSPNDSDEKSNKVARKEEKKRKPSVFSRFQSSYRTKKNKDKENKSKHRFVAISFSNATACDVCHKPMANKAALRCENCLVNVHEHNCKDQVIQCDKNRTKALQRDGSSHGAHGPRESSQAGALTEHRQSASVQHGTSLRPSQSFKDKRSSSAPVKTQPPGQLSAPPQLSHRHSLPTASLFGSPPNLTGSFLQWQSNAMGRFSVLDKAISEETEGDAGAVSTGSSNMEAPGHPPSNMTDTISESMESLDGVVPSEVSWLEDEPDLQLAIEEPEAWSITVDRKTLKKLGTKDIKRQDTIWELINTEKQYVKRLKIMQKIFAQSMLRDMNFTQEQVDRLFPRLDELVALHADFLRQLLARQAKNEDRFVEDIGDILLAQFQDSTAERMKSLYGVFCSKHTEAMQLYKEFLKVDRKFQNFAKKCTNLGVCEKRDISDFILGVTVRLSKYPILIEAILKSTKDKKDRENMSRALLMSKEVVQHIDEKVAAYEKLLDIVSKMDSRAVTFKNKKFKRQDLNSEGRELLHSGKIGWKSARGRIYDVLAVVLTDIIVFLQKNEQKYTFLMQDNKSCVIPLYRLLIREKQDARDSLGIYMISTNHITPEMYELVCSSKPEREDWIRTLQEAIRACPPEVESEEHAFGSSGRMGTASQTETAAMVLSIEQERRRREEHANHIKLLIEQLHEKDDAIKVCCDEKSKLMLELLELSTPRHETGSRPNSQEIVTANESVDIVQAAMEEASRLTTILQGSGTQLSRSVSSVGEHHSSTFVATPVPKRAETFAGFDSSHDSPKMSAMKQKFASGQESEGGTAIRHERSPSDLSLDGPEGDTSLSDMPEAAPQSYKDGNTLRVQQHLSTSQNNSSAHLWEEPNQQQPQQQLPHPHLGSDRSSDRESLGELSAASVSSLVIPTSPSPSNHEQMTSIFHLVQYLNSLMNLTSKQCTKVESLRAELSEAKAEIAKLSEDMQQQQQHGSRGGGSFYGGGGGGGVGPGGRRNVYRHDQLEELRNLQENISRERQEWERVKLQDRAQLEQDRQQLEQERRDLEKEKMDLRNRKEDLKRQREALQRQIDMMREQGYVITSPFADQPQRHHSGDSDADKQDSSPSPHQQSGRSVNHRRSASADFYSTVGLSDVENIQGYPSPSASGEPLTHQARSRVQPHPRLSVGSLSSGQQGNPSSKPPQQPGLPMHLLSARNEQRMGGVNVQKLPLKLSGGSNNTGASLATSVSSSALLQQQQPHLPNATVSPSAAFYAGVHQPFPGRTGGVSRVQSMSAASRAALAQHGDNSRGTPSSLARVMKLADPKGKSSPTSSSANNSPTGKPPHTRSMSSSSKSASSKPPAPQPSGSPGAPGAPVPSTVSQPGKEGPEGIIYF